LITSFLLLVGLPRIAQSQSTDVKPIEFRGHYIGESTVRFLHLESEAREDVEVCRQHSTGFFCKQFLAAIERGERAQISVSVASDLDHPDSSNDTINFVLDGKKLVKLAMLLTDVTEVSKTLGRPSRESAIPSHNNSGENWVNHLTIWETPDVCATLYQDNNPILQDPRPVFVLESREEYAREYPELAQTGK
jgi:hypothetical protein